MLSILSIEAVDVQMQYYVLRELRTWDIKHEDNTVSEPRRVGNGRFVQGQVSPP